MEKWSLMVSMTINEFVFGLKPLTLHYGLRHGYRGGVNLDLNKRVNNNKQFSTSTYEYAGCLEFTLIVFVFDFIPGIAFDPKVGSGNDIGK